MALDWAQLAAAFTAQAKFSTGYSPLYEAICNHIAGVATRHANGEPLEFDEQALIDLLEDGFRERTFSDNVVEPTLMLLGAIHAAVLTDAPSAQPISRFYATAGGSFEPEYDRDVLIQMLGGLFLNPGDVVRDFLKHGRIQTNEVSRGAAWLLPALVISAWGDQPPITLVDLGCSAGLNLAADAQAWRWLATDMDRALNPISEGEPLVTQRVDFGKAERSIREALPATLPRPNILKRIGYDLNPLHLDHPEELLDLRALIWGDQAARLARFDRAVAAYQALSPAPELYAANIIDAAQHLHEQIAPGTRVLLVYNTITTLYLPDPEYAALRRNIEASFQQLPDGVRGVWIELEAPRFGEPATPPKLFAIKAHLLDARGELEARYLAYTEAHPQTIMLLEGWEDLQAITP
jgi:hypothetical protein